MHIEKQDYGTGWFSIHVGLSPKEIDALIWELQDLKNDPDQHFHIPNRHLVFLDIKSIERYHL